MQFLGLRDGVLDYLRVRIIAGDLKPGQKLNEVELAAQLDISRGPLREAFRLLEGEHLITNVPRKGCYVSSLTLEDCKKLFEFREMIECFSIDLIVKRGVVDLSKMESALESSADLDTQKNLDPNLKFQNLKKILAFHISLVESSGNYRLSDCFQAIFFDIARYRAIFLPNTELWASSYNEHEQIIELIKEKKPEEAKALLKRHINKALELSENGIRKTLQM